MLRTLLINELDIEDRNKMVNIFFLIGDMENVTHRLLDYFNSVDSEYYGKGMLKYDGIELSVQVGDIPEVVRELVKLNVDIYGIYELYKPE
ncbi:hypothetical protein EF514_10110 [Anaerosphaera multitolerans]|uniref:Uncharacterized protein n=2 Tax=Anaerosphaera multitolerans TaxID=2487351 RepID=A0A437S4I7_9FIRM|nr:hypothetical protein EF514_10110 [Anaerosphaera multitolerans]